MAVSWCAMPAIAAEDKPIGEWIAWAREQQPALPNPDAGPLFRGASIFIGPYSGRKEVQTYASAGAKADLAAFDAFLKERGEPLYDRWFKGEALDDSDKAYEPVFHGMACSRYFRRRLNRLATTGSGPGPDKALVEYCENVQRAGHAALKKGYLSGRLSEQEIRDLWKFAVCSDIECTGGKYLPFHLDLSRSTPFACGEEAPDFALPTFDAVVKGPG